MKGLPNKAAKVDNRSAPSKSCIHPVQQWMEHLCDLHQDSLFGVNILIHQLLEYWLPMALGTALPEVMDSVRGGLPPVTGAADTKAPPFWLNLRQLRKVIPGLELLTELAGDSVLASLCPIQPALLPYRCISRLHSSINLLDAILFQNAIPGSPIKENLICV